MPTTIGTLPDYPVPAFPEVTGYAKLGDVEANVNAGTWNSASAASRPTRDQVADFLKMATAKINLALRKRGYFVPLRAQGGFAPPTGYTAGDLIQGVLPDVWHELRYVAAAYATHRVEASRAAVTGATDQKATDWLAHFNEFMKSLNDGTDNLSLMGVDGDFAPLGNESTEIGSGNLDPKTALFDPNDPSTWSNRATSATTGIFSVVEDPAAY